MFTFSNEYLLKSMWASVRDEGDRIVSLGLASHADLKKIIEPSLQEAIKKSTNGSRDNSLMLRTLSIMYDDLKAVALPGDFESLTKTSSVYLDELMGGGIAKDLLSREEVKDEEDLKQVGDDDWEMRECDVCFGKGFIPNKNMTSPADTRYVPCTASGCRGEAGRWYKKETSQEAIDKKVPVELDFENDPLVQEVSAALEDIVYKLGREGNHEAAYLVERAARKIEELTVTAQANPFAQALQTLNKLYYANRNNPNVRQLLDSKKEELKKRLQSAYGRRMDPKELVTQLQNIDTQTEAFLTHTA